MSESAHGSESSKGVSNYDYIFKILLIGDSMVGKSSLVLRYAKNEFSLDFMTTIGVDFLTRTEIFHNNKVVMQIWDTAGQPRFKSITNSYYKGAHGIAVVFDLSDRQTFSNVQNWLKDVKNLARSNVKVLIIGNKSDLERQVTKEEAEQLAEDLGGFTYIETSAKSGDNVCEGFNELGLRIFEEQKTHNFSRDPPKPFPKANTKTISSCCNLM